MKNFLLLILTAVAAFNITSCSKVDPVIPKPPVTPPEQPSTQGVVFKFEQIPLYAVNNLSEIKSIKVVVIAGESAKRDTLHSLTVTGDDKASVSDVCELEVGDYRIMGYVAYNAKALEIFSTEIDTDNKFSVVKGEVTDFNVPFVIKYVVDPTNAIKNVLIGLCLSEIGEDQSLWPWKIDEYLIDWPGLEFELDDNNNPIYVSGLCLSGKDFPNMTKVPDLISGFVSLDNLTLTDMPNLRELPNLMADMRMTSLVIYNCGLEQFPEVVCKMPILTSLTISKNNLKAVPASIGQCKSLRVLSLANNKIATVASEIGAVSTLVSIDLQSNPLTSFDVKFTSNTQLVELNVNHTQLTTVPESLVELKKFTNLLASGCKMTTIPTAVKNHTFLRNVDLSDNQITSVTTTDFTAALIESIDLSGNPLTSTVSFAMPLLIYLDLDRTGLTAMPDISRLPKLAELRLAGNPISSVEENYFLTTPEIGKLTLSDNALLASLPSTWGFPVDEVTGAPLKFRWLDISKCPNLTFEIPDSWCCIETQMIDGELYIYDKVVVKSEGSAGVTTSAAHTHP